MVKKKISKNIILKEYKKIRKFWLIKPFDRIKENKKKKVKRLNKAEKRNLIKEWENSRY